MHAAFAGPNAAGNAQSPDKSPQNAHDSTPNPAPSLIIPILVFALYSHSEFSCNIVLTAQKCKLLLHLGNSRAFRVDFKIGLAYDLWKGFFPTGKSHISLPASRLWFRKMAILQKNTCAPDSPGLATEPAQKKSDEKSTAEKKLAAKDSAALPSDADLPSPENLLQEYIDLRARYQRTTNALASAAHDLKTPLAILNGYVELLQSTKLGPITDRQREVLKDMQASGKRLQQFIQDFLTFSVLETGGLRVQCVPGDINLCLSDVCRLWSGRFQERGLALYFLANDKLPVFPFDSPKLERVISNLLENAFKFTPQGGTVWLHAEPHMWERRVASQPAAPGERRRQSVSQPNSVQSQRGRHRPRNSAGVSSGSLRRFFPPPLQHQHRRRRPRSGHRPPPGSGHGRKNLARKRTRRGLQVFLSSAFSTFNRRRAKRKK